MRYATDPGGDSPLPGQAGHWVPRSRSPWASGTRLVMTSGHPGRYARRTPGSPNRWPRLSTSAERSAPLATQRPLELRLRHRGPALDPDALGLLVEVLLGRLVM